MTATNNASTQAQDEPIKALFDLASYYVTVWGLVGACLWIEHRIITEFEIPLGKGSQVALFLVSIPATFLFIMSRINRDPKTRLFVERVRYIAILFAAAGLGAYLYATKKDDSYEARLREGAIAACSKIEACKANATRYADTK
jgi:hypothetical protein